MRKRSIEMVCSCEVKRTRICGNKGDGIGAPQEIEGEGDQHGHVAGLCGQ